MITSTQFATYIPIHVSDYCLNTAFAFTGENGTAYMVLHDGREECLSQGQRLGFVELDSTGSAGNIEASPGLLRVELHRELFERRAVTILTYLDGFGLAFRCSCFTQVSPTSKRSLTTEAGIDNNLLPQSLSLMRWFTAWTHRHPLSL